MRTVDSCEQAMSFAYTGIRVRDLERSLVFYTQVMGMKEAVRGTMDTGGTFVQLTGLPFAQRLELNYYPVGTEFHEPYKQGSEMDHLAFWEQDIDRCYRELIASGARKAVEPFSQGNYRLAFVRDPDGIWIELIGKNHRKTPSWTFP